MDRVSITIRQGVVGDDGTDWLPGTTHEASVAFARDLVARGAAVPTAPVSAAPLTTDTAPAVVPAKKGKR